jgi:alginate O-acetyltransferase complex protein AlgI
VIFTELRFFFFFALVFVLHWALRPQWARKTWLLVASYLFYAAWDWRFLSLIIFSTAVDYGVGVGLGKARGSGRRWALVSLSVLTNLGLLGVFKYYDFFLGSLEELFRWFGFGWHGPTYAIILPVGISFYTFQTLSYSIDVYRRQLAPTRNLLDLALFVAFFPQLVAGPIVRARDFLPQLRMKSTFSTVALRSCLVLFLVGFVKKACISDNIAPFVDQYFAQPEAFNVVSAWIAVLFYSVQIYCDFSGYSDMAIAVAGLLGYQLGKNFNFPYLAGSIQQFWQRWHISLSGWLRDYLYISLGGNRGGRLRTYRNLMLTMLLGGLWHGAAWTFVIWGGLHGAALGLHRLLAGTIRRWTKAMPLFGALGTLLTFYWVCLAWIFFRAMSLPQALLVSRAFVFFEATGERTLNPKLLILFIALAGIHWLSSRKVLSRRYVNLPDWGFAAAYGAAAALALALATRNAEPFIYFQF